MLACSMLLAQQAPVTGTIEGVVVRSDTGEPVVGATVTLSSSNVSGNTGRSTWTLIGGQIRPTYGTLGRAGTASTDAAGSFSFKELKAGTYRVVVTAKGFADQQYGQKTPASLGKLISLLDGQSVLNANVRLLPETIINGRVFDEKGLPAPGASVQLLRVVYSEEGKGYRFIQEVTSDDQGRYRLYGAAPGCYYLRAATGTVPTPGRRPGAFYSVSFYPKASTLDTASPIEVHAGRDEFFDLSVRKLAGPYRIRGRVLDGATGQPPQMVEGFLSITGFAMSSSRSIRPSDYDPATGNFEIRNIDPGIYDLMLSLPFTPSRSYTPPLSPQEQQAMDLEYSGMRRTALPLVVEDRDIEGLVFTIGKSQTLRGRYLVEGRTAPIPGIQAARVAMALRNIGINEPATVLPTAVDGSFEVRLRDGDYRYALSGIPDSFYLKSVRYGGEEVTNKPLRISDPVKGTLDVLLGAGAVEVSGTVKDGSFAQVVLIPEERGHLKVLLATADAAGRFRLRSVPPGNYRLYAWDSVDEGAYYDPEFLKINGDRGRDLRILEAINQTVDVELLSD